MTQTEQLIHDSRRVPAYAGVPSFLGGLCALWLAAEVVSSCLFDYNLPPFAGKGSGSPFLGFLAALGLGLFLVSVPFLRNRIFYDAEHNQVLVRHSGLFGRSLRQLPLAAATGVEIQVGHGAHGGVHWNIWVQLCGGKREWLTQLGSVNDAEGVGRSLSEAARLPLLKT
jgi:hypothetical protein